MTVRRERQDPPAAGADEGFLGRWLRRKHAARRSTDSRAEAPPGLRAAGLATRDGRAGATGAGAPARAAGTALPPAVTATASPFSPAPATEPELPPLESLDSHSDFRPFLSPKVGPDLRRQALRKLFHLPEHNVRDDLSDYWEDYSEFEPLGDLVPHEMRAALEREARRLAEAAGGGEPPRAAAPPSADIPASDASARTGPAAAPIAARGDQAHSPEPDAGGKDQTARPAGGSALPTRNETES